MKKLIALACVFVFIFALVGCGSSNKRQIVQVTLSTEDSVAILNAAGIRLPDVEEAAGANSTPVWFAWYDPFHNYDEAEIVNTGFFTFKEKYGCDIEWIECDYFDRNDDLANLVLSGNSPDFCPAGYGATATFPLDCFKGMYVPVNDYVDYDDPLWSSVQMADYYKVGNDYYAIVTTIDPSNVVVYNKRVVDEWGFDDPAELYWNDEWTWDVYYDMCIEFSDPDENRYALDGYAYAGALVEATGEMFLQKDENGHFYSNIDSPAIERAQNVLYDLIKNDCAYHEGTNHWALRDGTFGAGLKEGTCLFYVIGTSFFTDPVEEVSAIWGDIEAGEVMFAPLPRDPQGDGNYYMASGPVGYMLVYGGTNHAAAALLAACERFKIVDPTVVSIDRKQLEETYLWNQDMLEMYDEQFKIAERTPVVYYTGNLQDTLNNALNDLTNSITRTTDPSTWGQIKEKYRDTIDYYIEELNSLVDDHT